MLLNISRRRTIYVGGPDQFVAGNAVAGRGHATQAGAEMDLAKTTRTPTRKAPLRQPKLIHYVIEIADWQWDFTFGIPLRPDRVREPYEEYRHLQVSGPLLRPKRAKVEIAMITFVPDPAYNVINLREANVTRKPIGIGQIDVRKAKMSGVLPLPQDVLSSLLLALSAGKLKSLQLDAAPLVYRSAKVVRFSFRQTYDPNDLPPDGHSADMDGRPCVACPA